MNAYLLFKDRVLQESSVDPQLDNDLELGILLAGMAAEDGYIRDTAMQVFSRENQCRCAGEILYRQEILSDCIKNPRLVRSFYGKITEALSKNRDTRLAITHRKAKYMLDVALKVMISMKETLGDIRQMAVQMEAVVRSQGLKQLLTGLMALFASDQLEDMERLCHALSIDRGITALARPGNSLRALEYHPIKTEEGSKKGLLKLFSRNKDSLEFDLDMNDPDISPALSRLKDAMSENAAKVVVQARDELFAFLQELKRELSFYIGCLNLLDSLKQLKIPFCMPMAAEGTSDLFCTDLYNVSLSLYQGKPSVPSSVEHTDKMVMMITGSNQGGKTTFLRSIGQALLMMNSGMYVAASDFALSCGQIYTHFIREEDRKLKSGKLDEELIRMNEIVDRIRPGDHMLFNESFSATNEEEGSGIALEIVMALQELGIHVYYVTHFYQLITLLSRDLPESVLYMNAAREEDGRRTYQIASGQPEVRGYGEDIYKEIFLLT
ncbi:MAG: hypothetical protein IJ137_06120 [Eubacterium sp.]|nr:hypothetical protein [Eubacterium sp.]